MSMTYTYDLLTAAVEQRHGFLKLRGAQADHEVRLMADAGLVEASFVDGKEGAFTSINRVTETGETFLRVFKDHALPSGLTACLPTPLCSRSRSQISEETNPLRIA